MSNIEEESLFPQELISRAERRPESDELLWRLSDMDAVICALEKMGKAILGFDVFAREADVLKVLAYPDFSAELKEIAKPADRLRRSMVMARDFMRTQKSSDQLRFTVTWERRNF